MLTYRCIRPHELTPAERAAWLAILRAEPALDSPYFRPEFTDLVAQVRDDVEVAVIEAQGVARGFWPFQRGSLGQGGPVGGRLSDFHAVIAPADLEWQVDPLLEACGLVAFDFHHLLAGQQPFAPYHAVVDDSFFIEAPDGFDAYRLARRTAGTDEVQQTLRKERKLEREVGPLRFEAHTDSRAVLEQLYAWKSAQYLASGWTDLFAFAWTRQLLERILAAQEGEFRGRLSALYVGDHLLAMHLGMQSGPVLHSWFPAYDRELSRYSPGLILFANLLRQAPEMGVARIDLGRGQEQYKRSLATGSVPVAEGCAELRSAVTLARQCWRTTRDWAKSSPLWGAVDATTGWLRRWKDWLSFR